MQNKKYQLEKEHLQWKLDAVNNNIDMKIMNGQKFEDLEAQRKIYIKLLSR